MRGFPTATPGSSLVSFPCTAAGGDYRSSASLVRASSGGPGTLAVGAGSIRYQPLILGVGATLDKLGVNFGSGTGGGPDVCKLMLYVNLFGYNKPGALLWEGADISITAAGWKESTGIGLVLAPGLYWTAYWASAAASPTALQAEACMHLIGANNIPGLGITDNHSWVEALAYGAAPNPANPGSRSGSGGESMVYVGEQYA